MEANIKKKEELLKQWFCLKLKVHKRGQSVLFKEGEVWWCNFGENIGVEVNGKNAPFSRPALVFKKLNRHSFMAIPLTSQPHQGSWYVKFEFKNKMSWANLAQAKTLSSKRLYGRLGTTTHGDFIKIKNGFRELYCNQ